MSEFSDEAIQAYVDQLLPEIQRSGESPRDVECAVTRAVLIWMEDYRVRLPGWPMKWMATSTSSCGTKRVAWS